jgi:hypothetical protein
MTAPTLNPMLDAEAHSSLSARDSITAFNCSFSQSGQKEHFPRISSGVCANDRIHRQ